VVRPIFGSLAEAEAAALWAELAALPGGAVAPAEPGAVSPRRDYESDSVPRASASWSLVGTPTQWGVTELVFAGPSHGNPFTDVELTAQFRDRTDRDIAVGGFYDGDGIYRIRFQAPNEGEAPTSTYGRQSISASSSGWAPAIFESL
jgi:hypothetical protein